jgi:cytochrome c biogenesis protein CcdA/thiol-disulfide isomerase/thioredoxin
MITLVVVGFLAGLITSISPCVLPVLPVVLTAGSTGKTATDNAATGTDPGEAATGSDTGTATEVRRRSWRPYGVIAGLVLSFCLSTLFGSLILSALHLPQDFLRDAGIVVLVIIGMSLISTRLGELLERPFTRIPSRRINPDSNGLVLGLGLGLLFVPCAGPVLAAIVVVGATHHIGLDSVVLTAAFGVGVGVPLLVLALAGDAITRRTSVLRRNNRNFRIAGGLVMILVAGAIGLNLTDGLQRHVPGYTTALQNKVEQNKGASKQLHQLTADGPPELSVTCAEGALTPQNCGRAPNFMGISHWLNTPDGKPLNLASLRGKVVLVDFWTYSCINCQRTLPHLEAWYKAYNKAGFVIVGVHTPEFAFEHVLSNVKSQSKSLGVKYPVAVDDQYKTWNAYDNAYWPADYLIDAKGEVRHIGFGEGDYSGTEDLIRQLLIQAHPKENLPVPTEIPDKTPTQRQTPETYLGYHYNPLHLSGVPLKADQATQYDFPASLTPDTFALSGVWTEDAEELTAGRSAQLKLSYRAHDVYLVMGGKGTVNVQVNGKQSTQVKVSGPPKLYTLVKNATGAQGVVTLGVGSGVQAYDFTFG